jgi:hypothetical protein
MKMKIGSSKISFVFRHRWEAGSDSIVENYEAYDIRRTLQLGIWAKKYEAVGSVRRRKDRKETVKNTFSEKNHVNCYMIGLNLLVCKAWIHFSFSKTFGS